MEMKNVKKITLPNKVPVYDTDYRQLDYIHFSGAERIGLGTNLLYKNLGFKITFLQDLGENAVGTYVMGYQNVNGSTNKQCTISNYAIGSPLTKLVYALNTNFQSTSIELYNSYSGTEPKHIVTVDNYKGTVKLGLVTKYTHSTAPVGETSTSGTFAIGAIYRNGSYSAYWKGKVYGFEVTRYASDGSSATGKFYPAQRKSDGVCGLYYINPLTLTGTFHAMTGTEITTNAAGNIVAEEGILLRYDDIDVKKIEDSNGDIIWGSYDAFPYRRLEYIDMEGKYFNTGSRPEVGTYYLDFSFPSIKVVTSGSYGVFLGCAGNYPSGTATRWFTQATAKSGDSTPDTIGYRLKSLALQHETNLSATDIKFTIVHRAYSTNNTSGTWWFALTNATTGNQVYGQYYNSSTYSMDLSKSPYVFINAHGYNNNGSTSASPTTLIAKGNLRFNLYRFYVKETDGSSPIKWDYYPCQRKSDGVIGLYNTKTSSFITCLNSNDTAATTGAGPTIDEYWDLQSLE